METLYTDIKRNKQVIRKCGMRECSKEFKVWKYEQIGILWRESTKSLCSEHYKELLKLREKYKQQQEVEKNEKGGV